MDTASRYAMALRGESGPVLVIAYGGSWYSKPIRPLDLSQWADHWSVVERQNRMKNDQVMTIQRSTQSGRAANFKPISGHCGHIFWAKI